MGHPLIAFNQQSPAHLLANYLTSQSISATVMQSDKEFVVVLDDHAHVDRAKVIAEDFLTNPTNPKYQQAAWDSGKNVQLAPSGSGFSVKNIINDAIKAPFTSVVFLLCVAVYTLSLLGLFAPIAQHLLMQPFSVLSENHEWWRLLGPAFIHFSALHIIFNLLWWGMLGAKIERRLG